MKEQNLWCVIHSDEYGGLNEEFPLVAEIKLGTSRPELEGMYKNTKREFSAYIAPLHVAGGMKEFPSLPDVDNISYFDEAIPVIAVTTGKRLGTIIRQSYNEDCIILEQPLSNRFCNKAELAASFMVNRKNRVFLCYVKQSEFEKIHPLSLPKKITEVDGRKKQHPIINL